MAALASINFSKLLRYGEIMDDAIPDRERERDENGVSTYLRTYYARELEPFFRPNLECLYRAGSWDFIRFSENFSYYAY